MYIIDYECPTRIATLSFKYDAHDLVVVQRYNYIHEDIRHHIVNLAYRYVLLCFAIRAFRLSIFLIIKLSKS